MSIFLSITTLFSLLSFLTTLLALVRVGSAAFLTNQLQHRIDFEVERANGSPQSPSPSSSDAVETMPSSTSELALPDREPEL